MDQPSFSSILEGLDLHFEAKPEGATLWWDNEDGFGIQFGLEDDEIVANESLELRFPMTQLLRKVLITDFFNEQNHQMGFYEINGNGNKIRFTASADQAAVSTNGEITLSINEYVDSIAFSGPENANNGDSQGFSVAAIEIASEEKIEGCLSKTDATARVDRECPAEEYTNHGEYVSCVAKTVRTMREGSEISASLALHLVALAARSDVGKKQ
jgi:hypothetical protein